MALPRTELHFHLLPGVDDGPAGLPEALALARQTVDDGTAVVTVTPHIRDLVEAGILAEVAERTDALGAALEQEGIALDVRPGAEVAHDDLDGLTQADLEAIAQGPAEARWVLLEAPLRGRDPAPFIDGVRAVRRGGLGVLVGHPERSPAVRAAPELLDELLAEGCAAQVNASSVLGTHGREAQAAALELVRTGRALVLASDAHRLGRGAVLTHAVGALAATGVPRERAERLTRQHPAALLADGLPAVRDVVA